MLDTKQQGALCWVERVRLERANGLREEDACFKHCGCTPYDESHLVGMTYEDAVQLPIRQNAVCPYTKVIVPVTPAFIIEEGVKVVSVNYPTAPYRIVDFNPCDSRTGVLKNIPAGQDTEMVHADTVVSYSTKVVDTLFDQPTTVKTVTHKIVENGNVEQPLAVNGTEPVNTITPDGKTAEKGVVSEMKPKKPKVKPE